MSRVLRRAGEWLRSFGLFWFDFVVGDDWRMAVVAVVAVTVTGVVAHAGVTAWPVLPLAVTAGLAWSVARAARSR